MSILDVEDFAVWIEDPKDRLSFTKPVGRTQGATDQKRSLREVADLAYETLVNNPDRPLEITLVRPNLDKLKEEYGLLSDAELREIASNHALALLFVNIGYIESYEVLKEHGFRFPEVKGYLD